MERSVRDTVEAGEGVSPAGAGPDIRGVYGRVAGFSTCLAVMEESSAALSHGCAAGTILGMSRPSPGLSARHEPNL